MALKKEILLKELLERTTNSKNNDIDEVAVELFCSILRDNPQLTIKAKDMIFEKMRSQIEIEATKSVALLEECMNSGCVEFQNEMGKKRSLNALSSLVLNSHEGANTAFDTKKRILQCLQVWSVNFPDKENIRIVYENLSEKSLIDMGDATAIAKRQNMLDIDEKEFSKLIKSKNPHDIKKANILIQQGVHQQAVRSEMLRQEEMRRIEAQRQLESILEQIKNTVYLLNQMLDTYETENVCNNAENMNENDAMRDLYNVCRELRMKLKMNFNDITDEQTIANIMRSNDILQEVLQRYKNLVIRTKDATPTNAAITTAAEIASQQMTATIIDAIIPPSTLRTHKGVVKSNITTTTTTPTTNKIINTVDTTDLLTQFTNDNNDDDNNDILSSAINTNVAAFLPNLNAIITKPTTATTTTATATTTTNDLKTILMSDNIINPLDELNDIFRNIPNNDSNLNLQQNNAENLFNLELLQPVKLVDELKCDTMASTSNCNQMDLRSIKNLPEIDELSEKLFKQNLHLNDRIGSFKKDPEKVTLNDMKKDNLNKRWQLPTNDNLLTSPEKSSIKLNDDNKIDDLKVNLDDDMMTDEITTEILNTIHEDNKNDKITNIEEIADNTPTIDINKTEIKHLSEININFDDILPTSEKRLVVDDDDVKITLEFTNNRPLQNVTTFVLVVHNKSKLMVKDYQFEASVKKPCKVRLLPATNDSMKPFKPFSPETPIYQIVLLLNPTGHSVDLSCIIGYKLGDDPDPIKESIIIKDLPFAE